MPDPSDPRRPERDDEGLSDLAQGYRKAAPYLAASTQLVFAVMACTALGYVGDRHFEHRVPWMLMVGAVLGMVGGFVSFFRTVLGKKDS